MTLNRGFEYREQIDHRGEGLTVLDYLTGRYRHSSQEDWRNRLDNGEVSLNGLNAGADSVLTAGQQLVWRRPAWDEPEVPLAYAVLYQDDDLLAVAKPGGLPTVPAGGYLEHTLLTLVRRSYSEASPIHRLGRGTSGVVLFARTARARSVLCSALRHNRIEKVYRALVSGIPENDRFYIQVPIGPVPHPRLGTIFAASPSGQRAASRVTILERRQDASLVEVTIETGKAHQIRIHMAATGHPLVGDPLYRMGGGIDASGAALPGDPGYLLHAERIHMKHPVKGSPFAVWCCPPVELRTEVEQQRGSDWMNQ